MNDDLQQLYQSEEQSMSVDITALHAKHASFARSVWWRNIREGGVGVVLALGFGWASWMVPDPIHKTGLFLLALACAFVAWRVGRADASASADPSQDTAHFIEAHRRDLLGQAALLDAVPRWYLGPFVPGFALLVGYQFAISADAAARSAVGTYGLFLVAMFAAILWINRRAARQLREQADQLG